MEIRKKAVVRLRLAVCMAAILTVPSTALAASSDEHRLRRPQLFSTETGYRIDRYRAPVPDDVPEANRVSAREARILIEDGAVAIDVFGAPQSRFDELDGTWMVSKPRASIPDSVWLPEVGRGSVSAEIEAYFASNLTRLTGNDRSHPLVIFCVADCWMSWNAAQRASTLGYDSVYWFAEGVDGWLDEEWVLERVDPVPVTVDD